jgi:hypothetical protein
MLNVLIPNFPRPSGLSTAWYLLSGERIYYTADYQAGSGRLYNCRLLCRSSTMQAALPEWPRLVFNQRRKYNSPKNPAGLTQLLPSTGNAAVFLRWPNTWSMLVLLKPTTRTFPSLVSSHSAEKSGVISRLLLLVACSR